MNMSLISRRILSTGATLVLGISLLASPLQASTDSLHILIPGGAGGGWDGTGRGTGEALSKSGAVKKVSYENMSGGGGGKAIAHLIETAKQQKNTLMVNSTPIVVRALTKVFPQSFRDLTPVAAMIADYQVIVVKPDSKYQSWQEVVAELKKNPRSVTVGGGSSKGSLDHLVPAAIVKAEGINPRKLRYIPYDAGGKAMAGLLSGEVDLLSTGMGEVLELSRAGQVKILANTAAQRTVDAPNVPTFVELGNGTVFANWRGFFAAPGLDQAQVHQYAKMLSDLQSTTEWENVRARNGWANDFKGPKEFYAFLEDQEKSLGTLMRELGFLK